VVPRIVFMFFVTGNVGATVTRSHWCAQVYIMFDTGDREISWATQRYKNVAFHAFGTPAQNGARAPQFAVHRRDVHDACVVLEEQVCIA
jgi:hypothetical protein